MSLLVNQSNRVFRRLLLLYPADLRREFGDAIADSFSEHMAEEWEENRLGGAIRVWAGALRELPRIVAPRLLEDPGIAVPFLSFSLACLWFGAQWLVCWRTACIVPPAWKTVLLPGVVVGAIAHFAARHSGTDAAASPVLSAVKKTVTPSCSKYAI